MSWTDEQVIELGRFLSAGDSFARISDRLNAKFGTSYTRNACIGKAQRLGLAGNLKPRLSTTERAIRVRENRKGRYERERAALYVAKPWLVECARIRQERMETSKRVRSTCSSKTSPTYRNHLPRAPEMTKGELRAMLRQAVENTVFME